jgi:hypothetical protein
VRSDKYYFRGLFLLGLALILSACNNCKHADIIVNSPIGLSEGVFSLTTLSPGFIATGKQSPPTPISYSVSLSGDTSETCDIRIFDGDGNFLTDQGSSGTTYMSYYTYDILVVLNCTVGTEVGLNIRYQIGTQKYEGSSSFTA